jgi:hypothetical protein
MFLETMMQPPLPPAAPAMPLPVQPPKTAMPPMPPPISRLAGELAGEIGAMSNRSSSPGTGSHQHTDFLRQMYAMCMASNIVSADDTEMHQNLLYTSLSANAETAYLRSLEHNLWAAQRKIEELEALVHHQQLAESYPPTLVNHTQNQQGAPPPGYLRMPSAVAARDTRSPRLRPLAPCPRRAFVPVPESQEERDLLMLAVESVSLEYFSDGTAFYVRRPMGLAMDTVNGDLWKRNGEMNEETYARDATVFQPTSLEVLAHVTLDGSLLVIHGFASGRILFGGIGEWNEFGDPSEEAAAHNLDESDLPMFGEVAYTAADGSEQLYSMDDIYNGARLVREQYCAAVVSMLAALRRQKQKYSIAPPNPSQALDAIDPSPLSSPPLKGVGDTEGVEARGGVRGFFINAFFGIIWTALVRVSLGTISTIFNLVVSILFLHLLWLYFADDHGAADIRAYIHHQFCNHPLTGIR